jgi:hypothetical protein
MTGSCPSIESMVRLHAPLDRATDARTADARASSQRRSSLLYRRRLNGSASRIIASIDFASWLVYNTRPRHRPHVGARTRTLSPSRPCPSSRPPAKPARGAPCVARGRWACHQQAHNCIGTRDAPVLPHVVDLVQAPDLREPGTDWRSQLAAGLDALSPAHVSTQHSAVLACSAPRSPGVLPLQHRAWVQLVRAQLEDAALVVRRCRGEVTAPMLSIHFWCNANNMTHRNSWQSWDLRCVSIGSIALYALAC